MGNSTHHIKLVIITGMSGAGKTVAIQCFEDLGYFCVDNLPPMLLSKFVDMIQESENKMDKVALVMDLRGRDFFQNLSDELNDLAHKLWVSPQILFLDSTNEVLVRRYKETRRTHPLAPEGGVLDGIQRERELLDEIKGRSQVIIDTSSLKPIELRNKIDQRFATSSEDTFGVRVVSFGFKHGMPIDADLVYDVRFLPNPFYIESMRDQTGLNEEVSSYVLKWAETQKFLEKLLDLLDFVLPYYIREGKRQLVIAIGCTGGQHRSVTVAEFLSKHFTKKYRTVINHRDIKGIKDHTNGKE